MWNSDGNEIISADNTRNYFHTALEIDDLIIHGESILVYPNPSQGRFTISSSNPISSFEIFSPAGELVYTAFNLNRKNSEGLDLSGQAKGIYMIKVYSGTNVSTRKIVVW